jgi:hypothetical protein
MLSNPNGADTMPGLMTSESPAVILGLHFGGAETLTLSSDPMPRQLP